MKFGNDFNKPIKAGVLPNSLTNLTFGYNFNQSIEAGVLPNSLTHLKFGNDFNKPIAAGVLPNSLTHLNFGWSFNQPIAVGVLPNSLTHLIFGFRFNQLLDTSILPSNLEFLNIDIDAFDKLLNHEPNIKIYTNLKCKLRIVDIGCDGPRENTDLISKYFTLSNEYCEYISDINYTVIDIEPKPEFVGRHVV